MVTLNVGMLGAQSEQNSIVGKNLVSKMTCKNKKKEDSDFAITGDD
jgi:hypothetical protein